MADPHRTNDLTEALASGDLESCRSFIRSSLIDEPSLRTYFQSLLAYAALHPLESARSHPVVTLNSLKNLVSLRLNIPSEPLVTQATKVSLSLRPDPPDKSWRGVSPERLNEPFFVMDLLTALEEGDREKAFEEAARMSHISDNETYLVDILTEAALREFPRLGLFGYAFHRAAVFCRGKDITPFAYRLLEAVSQEPIGPPFPTIPDGFRVDVFAGPVLTSGDTGEVILLAVADRLWNLDSMKGTAYRRAVVGWLGQRWAQVATLEKPAPGPKGQRGDWPELLKNGDTEAVASSLIHVRESEDSIWPVEVAETWISQGITEDPNHFVMLDALQHLVKVLPEEYMTLLAQYLIRT
ncbi:MAG: hypothetical protein ACE5HZ_06530 [Fidelibacterota bacterium]